MTIPEHAIDLDHLNRYTGGDRALNEEILRIFETQSVSMLARLEALAWEDGAGGKAWREITHGLKGAARGVGAFALGDIAAEAEKVPVGDKAAGIEIVDRLKTKCRALHLFVEQLVTTTA
jgi:HPt (histidine-containing phosphotransfer) domain-containing protein